MSCLQFRRFLAAQGVTFEERAKHTKLYYRNKQSTLPRHGSRGIGEGLRRTILKQLGLKEK